MQKLLKCIEERTIVSFSGGSMDRKENGVVLRALLQQSFGSAVNVRQLAIKTVAANYLICNPVDESDEIDTTTDFTVAKDPTFRGNDPRQIVGPNGVLVSQDLDPHYEIGQIIYAVFGVNVDSDAVDANGDSIEVLEISPSRQWVDQWVKVCATVDGVQHQIAVRGTTILPGT